MVISRGHTSTIQNPRGLGITKCVATEHSCPTVNRMEVWHSGDLQLDELTITSDMLPVAYQWDADDMQERHRVR